MKRREQIKLVATREEKTLLEMAARATNTSLSEFIRNLCLPAARAIVTGKDEEQIRLAINSTGVLLASKVTTGQMTLDDQT